INSTGEGVLYVDGYPEITFTTAVRPQATDQFSIGQEWDGGTPSEFFRGLIDEVAIFDRAVALTEIGALMVLPKPAFNLNFDLVEENTNYNTANLYDTTGTRIIAYYPGDSPGCPEFTRGDNWSLGSPYGQHASGPGRIHIGQSNTDPLPDLSHGQFTQSFWVNLVTMEDGKIVLHDTWDGTYFAPWLSFVPDDDENNHDYGKIAVGFLDAATGDRMSFTTPNAVVASRRWHHIAAVYDGNQYILYVDGERVADSGTLFNGRKPPRRGDYFVNIPFTVAGIDEVKIYQVALTAAQIKEVYGGGFNLISHLPFEDAPGSTTFDNASDLGNNAYCADATCPATSLPGRVGRALGFTSANHQRVTLPYAGGQTPVYALTVAAWIKGNGELLSWTHETNGEVLRLDTNSFFVKTFCENGGHCRLGVDSAESETVNFPGGAIPNDQWTHVAVTFDGDWQTYYLGDGSTIPQHQMHLYVNGVEVANKIDSPIGGMILP
ncbi:MAG: hypothetical protein KDE31_18395, partial [Caldilineaceae bacterium]|nr:hypothetical protein [Caldilineaceae bacterium]